MDVNPMSKIWKNFSSNALLCVRLSKVHESGKVGHGLNYGIYGRWENFFHYEVHEITKLQNWFCDHLNLVVHMFAQPFYTVDMFPYDDAIMAWTNEKERRGLLAWCFLENNLGFSMMLTSCTLGKFLLPIGPIWFSFYDQTNIGLQVRIMHQSWVKCSLGQEFNSLTWFVNLFFLYCSLFMWF